MSNKVQVMNSPAAKKSAARLAAVQGLYQMRTNEQTAEDVIYEYKKHRLGKSVEGQEMIPPDGVLFSKILKGCEANLAKIEGFIDTALVPDGKVKAQKSLDSLEPLLQAILFCGTYEILAHMEIDAPIIISDYLEVTHAFFEGGESKMVNAVLDRMNKSLR